MSAVRPVSVGWRMADTKRLILRAVLRQVSPMVIRLISVSDRLQLADSTTSFAPFWAWTAILATSSASTARSSIASADQQ